MQSYELSGNFRYFCSNIYDSLVRNGNTTSRNNPKAHVSGLSSGDRRDHTSVA